ncbi:hypothetical protein [Methylomonas fluvii]|uniref:Uncharacterized protein n=1 Tax=Methylomonas fluvii TaxID=1854564 RepID=A0ABR9D9C2_9GAMM|nr:hypothetical protein [Methylomonas fluvii]MBD9359545.1 hypothetical protein [Methylomonas fluvii]
MIPTEIHTWEIPEIYKRFAEVIGDQHWKNRVALLKQDIKGNIFLVDYIQSENSIAFQLERLRELTTKFGTVPSWEFNNQAIYPAASFASQALSIMDTSPKQFAEQLKRRIHGALKNPDDMRALLLELSAATHFAQRGLKISWPELTGIGSFDLFIEELGSNGLEVECKSISTNKGRKIHRQEVLDFYGLLWTYLQTTRKGLQTGLSVVLTVPDRLPKDYKSRTELAKQISKHVIFGQSTTLPDGSSLKITDFDIRQLSSFPSTSNPKEARSVIDEISDTRNRETMVIGTKAGGALAFTVQSGKDDTLIKAIFDTLSDSAKKQLSGSRSGLFWVELFGVDAERLISIASQDKDSSEPATALRLGVSNFLSTPNRDAVIGVGFVSKSNLFPQQSGFIDSGGSAYFFPNRASSLWSDDFSGLFS